MHCTGYRESLCLSLDIIQLYFILFTLPFTFFEIKLALSYFKCELNCEGTKSPLGANLLSLDGFSPFNKGNGQ